jgi:putative Holliday junction resolvase
LRTLGLDVGTHTVGIAVSDPLGMIAQPVETLRRTGRKKDVAHIVAIALDREVGQSVGGLPIRQDGTEGDSAREARRMGAAIEEALESVPVIYEDERYTTAQAERALISGNVRRKKRKGLIDQVAAVLILQSFLDRGGVSLPKWS